MRPKSAVNRRKLTNQKKSESTTKKKQPYNSSYSSVSRVQSRFTSMTHKWQIKTQKLKVCKDAKSIALIHAYQPKRLKQCIVSDPKSYQRFYNNFGQCQLTNLYTKSFLKHFREWRRNLRQRITNVVSMLSQTKEQIKPEQVQMVLRQIQGITEQLKSATSAVLNAKDAQNSKGARELFENFEHMQDYIKKLAEIVRHLCQYIKYINKLLQEGADKSQQQSLRQIQKKVKKLHKEYERKLVQPLQFCTSHPESTFMNRTEYKMKLKFDHIAKQAIRILEQIFKLTIILQNFQDKFQAYTDKKMRPQEYTVDILQQIATLISTYEQYKLKDKGTIPQQQNQITKSNEVILKLKTKINSQIRLFLDTFKEKSHQILNYQLKEVKNQKVIDSIKNYANRFKICKKKILILTKIFNKYNYPQYYEVLTNSIKQTSQNFQNIGQLIEQMTKVSNNKKIHNRVKVCRVIQSILPFVKKYEDNKSKIALSISKIIIDETSQNQSEKQGTLSQSQSTLLQSEKLMKFLQIMHFSQNQTQQLLSIPHYQVKQPTSIMTDEQIEIAVQSNIQQIYRLSHDVFPNAHRNSMQLNKLINDELINKFVAFSDDIMKESIHSFQIFQEFYQKIYGNEGHQDKKIHKKGIVNMLDYFNETIEKFNGYKNSISGKNFLQWMFENRMAMHVLNSMKKVNKILNDDINKQYWSLSEKIRKCNVCYRMNMEVKQYIGEKKQLLQEIVRSSSKYVRQKSIFDYYFNQCLKKISDFEQKQKIYEQFDNSVETGQYWPTFNMLYQWDNQQFDYYLDQSVSASTLRDKRKQIYKQLQDCLFKLNKQTSKEEKNVQLGLKFINQCERKKKDIKQILLPLCRVESKIQQSSQKVKKYKELSKSLTSYLIKNSINHIGLVAQSEDIILILNNKNMGNYDEILEGLEKRLKLDPFSLERNELNSKFIPMEISKIVKQVWEKYGNKKQNSAQFLLSQKTIEGKRNANLINNSEIKDQIQQQNNYDEVFDQQIEEQDSIQDGVDMVQSIIQQTSNLNKNKSKQKDSSTGFFVLQNKNSGNGQKGQVNPSFVLQENQLRNKTEEYFYNIPDGYREYAYYKIKQLTNLQKVSQCLRGGKKQNEVINKNIQISKLVLGFEKQPNKQLVDHLNQIISQTSKNNFMSVLNNKNKLTKSQQILQNLKQVLLCFQSQLISPQVLHELRTKKQTALANAFNLVNCKYRYLYDEGDQGNRIILCQFANNQHYVHAVLNNQSPLAKEGQLVSDRICVEIQKLYLNSLLKLPYEKNGNMQQIIEEIRKCNQQIGKKYKKLKDTLSLYKQQGSNIGNRKELDDKIQHYYEQKSKKQRKFTVPGLIDYDSYKIFLSQYEEIYGISKNKTSKLCKILINGRIQLTLFMSNNPQQVKNTLSTIIPSIYNSFPFVERNSLEMINIKYTDILKHILENQLKDYRNLSPPQIFDLLYGSGYGNSNNISPYNQQTQDQISRLVQKLDKLFQESSNKASVKDFTDVANLGKIIGLIDYIQILNRLGELQGQKQLLQKISTIRKSSAAFILKNNEETQKQREYLQNVDDCASFILERQAQKVEIPSYMLQEVNDVLNKMKISHWVMRHKNAIIGLGDGNASAEMTMKKCLNIKQIKNINWKQKSGGQNKWEKQIEIQALAIQLSISNMIKENVVKGKEEVAYQAIDNHFIEINNENNIQTIVSINKMNEKPVIVHCKYPRRSIQIKLKKKVNPNDNKSKSKNIEVEGFITKSYNYGSKYNLIAFENQIIKDILSQYDQLRIQEQRKREQERKRKQQEQQRKIKQQEEHLKKIELQIRKKQEEQIRKKILEDQIRNKIQQQQKLKKLKQEKEKQRQKEQERERIKEKQKEYQKNSEQKRQLQKKGVDKKEKGKKIIIKNRDQKDAIQLFYNYSEDDRRQVSYENISKRKKVNKQKKIEKESTNSEQSQTSEMSIILSENNEIQRQELKKKNRIYRFTNVNELIKANKAMFILDD